MSRREANKDGLRDKVGVSVQKRRNKGGLRDKVGVSVQKRS